MGRARRHLAAVLLPACLSLAACAAPETARAPVSAAPPPAPLPPPPPPVEPERWSGLVAVPVTEDLARQVGLGRAEGLYVRAVEPGSPAARAGIRAGDVVLLVGQAYAGTLDAVGRALAAAPLGGVLEVALRRAGDLVSLSVPVEASPAGRPVLVIRPPVAGLLGLAADGRTLWAYGPVPGSTDRGIIPIQLPGGPLPDVGPRPVAAATAERVIAADGERVYLGWAGSELYIDVYEVGTGGVSRLAVRGAESVAGRCRPRGLAVVGTELWMACLAPDAPRLARIDRATGQARVEPLPAAYWSGLAFDGQAVLWLCCVAEGGVSVARTDVQSGATRVFPLPEPARAIAADGRAVYLLGPAGITQHTPWR